MIVGFFGVPGCGKTTLATYFAQKELKKIKRGKSKYKHVLTNFYCKGCEKVDFTDLGIYDIQDSLIILDEITVDADNRDFKRFSKSSVNFFVYHRHYFNDVYYFTQQWDAVDKKIRNLTQNLYRIKKRYLFPFVTATKIFRTCDIDDRSHELVIGYRFAKLHEIILSFFGNRNVGRIKFSVFAPRLWKYFDSYCQPFSWAKWIAKSWDGDE